VSNPLSSPNSLTTRKPAHNVFGPLDQLDWQRGIKLAAKVDAQCCNGLGHRSAIDGCADNGMMMPRQHHCDVAASAGNRYRQL
jgi:hypothetical protein